MDWNRLAAWIYLSSTVDWTKAYAYDVGVIYVDPRSPNAAAVIADIRSHGCSPGIYTVPSWAPTLGGSDFAIYTSDLLNKFLPRGALAEAPPYMADLEARSVTWQQSFLTTYRSYQPARPSSYTNEPFKNGSVVPIPDLKTAKFHWYPQTYYGDMSAADAAAVMLDLCRWGYEPSMIHPFYAGERFPWEDHRDGCVFTLERLP